MYDARSKRGARLLAAGALAAVAIFGASQADSGSDRSQPATAAGAVVPLGSAGAPQEYTVTSATSNGTRTVSLERRGSPVTSTSTRPGVRVSATTKG